MKIFQNKIFVLSFFIIFSIALFLASFPIQAIALGLGGVSIRPSLDKGNRDWFIYTLKPGETAEDYIDVMNYSEKEQYLEIHAYDSEPSDIGAFALSGPNNTQKGIGLWVKLDEDHATLAPEERKKIRFTITVPEDADTGEHSGAITVQTAPKELKGVTGISIGTRVGARVYVTVPGKIIKKIKIISFTVSEDTERNDYKLILIAKNEGNVSLMPETRLIVGGWGLETKRKVFHERSQVGSWQLMRGTEVSNEWRVPRPYFGKYTFQVILNYEDENNVAQRVASEILTLWVIPWKDAAVLGVILFVLLALIIIFLLYRKRKYSGKGWDEHKVKENDNIMALAQKHAVSWKYLVKVNRIKKPYFLTPGQTMLLPPSKKPKGEKDDEKTSQKENQKEKKKRKIDIMKWVLLIMITLLTTAALIVAVILFIKSMDKGKEGAEKKQGVTQGKVIFGADEDQNIPQEGVPVGTTATTTSGIATSTEQAIAQTPTTTEPSITLLVDKDVIHISLLNGSGVAGYAGKIANILKKDGYKEITFGNADRFDYKDVTITYLEGFKETAENIQKLLKNEYENFTVNQVEKQGSAVVVILGK